MKGGKAVFARAVILLFLLILSPFFFGCFWPTGLTTNARALYLRGLANITGWVGASDFSERLRSREVLESLGRRAVWVKFKSNEDVQEGIKYAASGTPASAVGFGVSWRECQADPLLICFEMQREVVPEFTHLMRERGYVVK